MVVALVRCAVCGINVPQNIMKMHVITDEHLNKREKTEHDPDWCGLCSVRVTAGCRSVHERGKKHREKLAELDGHTNAAANPTYHCLVCDCEVPRGRGHRQMHEKGAQHVAKAFRASAKQQQNQGGKTVAPVALNPSAVHVCPKGRVIDISVEICEPTMEAPWTLDYFDARGMSPSAIQALGEGVHRPSGVSNAPIDGHVMRISGLKLDTSQLSKGMHAISVLVTYVLPGQDTLTQHTCVLKAMCTEPAQEVERETMKPVAPYTKTKKERRASEPLEVFEPPKPVVGVLKTKFGFPKRYTPERRVRDATLRLEPAMTNLANEMAVWGDSFETNYAKSMHTLLMAEELAMENSLRLYDMKNVSLRRRGQLYVLRVPGLAEARPSVLCGDKIRVTVDKKAFRGAVEFVESEEILVAFHQKFKDLFLGGNELTVDLVRFELSHVLLDMQHEAVDKMPSYKSYVLPREEDFAIDEAFRRLSVSDDDGFRVTNRDLNPEQILAVKSAMAWKAHSPFVIFGPPGTGKTTTAVEIAAQIYHAGERVLLMAPSNTACDLLLERLIAFGNVPKSQVLRVCSYSRTPGTLPEALRGLTNWDATAKKFMPPISEKMEKARVIAMTSMCAARLSRTKNCSYGESDILLKQEFENVLVDEAGHSTEPEILAGIVSTLKPGGRLILAGDPRQLGACIHWDISRALEISMLERLCMPPESFPRSPYSVNEQGSFDTRCVCMLTRNYRAHPELIKLPSRLFYFDKLTAHADAFRTNIFIGWDELPNKHYPMVFHGVQGEEMREANSPSFFNPDEIMVAVEWIEKVISRRGTGISAEDIAVVTPYHKQKMKMKAFLERKRITGVNVGSTELLQGQEFAVVLITTCRSDESSLNFDRKHNLGFMSNPKRFNVAVTRAKALMIAIGNPNVMAHDENWGALINQCVENHAYIGCEFSGPSNGPLFPDNEDGNEELAAQLKQVDDAHDRESFEIVDFRDNE